MFLTQVVFQLQVPANGLHFLAFHQRYFLSIYYLYSLKNTCLAPVIVSFFASVEKQSWDAEVAWLPGQEPSHAPHSIPDNQHHDAASGLTRLAARGRSRPGTSRGLER